MIRRAHHHPDDEAVARWAEHALASVYRVLDLPAGLRLVHRIDLGGGVARWPTCRRGLARTVLSTAERCPIFSG